MNTTTGRLGRLTIQITVVLAALLATVTATVSGQQDEQVGLTVLVRSALDTNNQLVAAREAYESLRALRASAPRAAHGPPRVPPPCRPAYRRPLREDISRCRRETTVLAAVSRPAYTPGQSSTPFGGSLGSLLPISSRRDGLLVWG